ncbi:hypothetical protein EDD29_3382 [Actinocorallia herbida]|uniref:Uncharacterized protein n=1 Tax=Actinocorallia herbida TaxID=58109 RepID=A0A3N1CX16_9ACTN|nr:DUF6328 family protein [Actinocorallia herbida]ROO85833.1 hypothetical protein EDD29_3382 [Actinocorallia herbida]
MTRELPDEKVNETPAERADRNFVEFLQGIRVAVTGVQVLFAFLLTVPFSAGFKDVSTGERTLFYLALVSAALASLFFIAPVAQHRILFRQGLKEDLVRRANLYGLIGTAALALSMTSATWLVTAHLFEGPLPSLTAAGIVLLAGWLWFVEPALHRTNNN